MHSICKCKRALHIFVGRNILKNVIHRYVRYFLVVLNVNPRNEKYPPPYNIFSHFFNYSFAQKFKLINRSKNVWRERSRASSIFSKPLYVQWSVITRKRLDVSNARRMQISIDAVINSASVRRYGGPGTIKYPVPSECSSLPPATSPLK